MIIYKITNIVDNKIYVGQTKKSLEERKKAHRNRLTNGKIKFHLYNAMRKYGWENFVFEELDSSARNQEELDILEQFYIEQLDAMNPDVGYNMYLGGIVNPMDSPIVKEKHLKAVRNPETRKKISESMKKHVAKNGFSEEHRRRISEGLYRRSASDYVHPQAGKPLSEERAKALRNSLTRSVYCVDESGKTIAKFDEVYQAAYWWIENGYPNVTAKYLCRMIKSSYKNDEYIRGIKWQYEKRV